MTVTGFPQYRIVCVLVNYNGERDTVECCESIIPGLADDDLLVVIDNCSDDSSFNHLKENVPGTVALVRNSENGGFASAINVALKTYSALADAFLLINNDSLLVSGQVKDVDVEDLKQNRLVKGFEVIDASSGTIQFICGGKINWFSGRTKHSISGGSVDFVSGGFMLFPSVLVTEIGFLDETFFLYWEDVDYSLRAKEKGYSFRCESALKFKHKESSSTVKHSPFFDYIYTRASVIFFRKYSSVAIAPLLIMVVGRIFKRIFSGHFKNILYLAFGWRDGWTGRQKH